MAKEKSPFTAVVSNRKAYHNYNILETYDGGLELLGPEVKSLRQKEGSLEGSFIRVEGMQAYIFNMHIKPYKFNSASDINPTRVRRLLLNKREIHKLAGYADIKGNALVPLEVYFKNGWAKVKIGVAKGKQNYDKRDSIKKKDLNREMERSFKTRVRF